MADVLTRLQLALAHQYTVEHELGRGGMATVYRAQDLKHGRPVALKVLRPELAASLGKERFLREIQIAARLNHPHILPLYDSGDAEGLLYYVMPCVEGESLRDCLDRQGQLPLELALRVANEVADALSYAHGREVVHRDIKPENILLEAGHAVVSDFGIARAVSAAGRENLTQTGIALGTPSYMSPEQAAGDPVVDGRSDIYSLGCVLFEMLAGRPPFTGPTPQAILTRRLTEPVPELRGLREHIPEVLERAVGKALARAPADRFGTAAQLTDALAACAAAATVEPSAPPISPGALSTRHRTRPRRPARKSIAVLPFVNMSPDRENEYFSDGMTEELITALSKIPGLHVAARTSAFAFKGKDQDVRRIGEQLGVSSVLEGSVRRAGDKLRVAAQLVDTSDGYHLWSETYDREMKDVFAIQDDISRAIVNALQLKLAGGKHATLIKRHTENLHAYHLYLQGRHFWNRRTEEWLTKAARCFEHAVGQDPNYALAYAGLADCFAVQAIAEYGALAPKEAMPKAKAAADKALTIDGLLAEAHTSLAHVEAFYDWQWAEAEKRFQRALALNPNYAIAHHWYAIHLAAMGRLDEALGEEKRAQELDPLSLFINKNLGTILFYARQFDQAVRQYRDTIELDPSFGRTHFFLGLAYEGLGRYDDAIAELKTAMAASGENTVMLAALGRTHALAGRRSAALQILDGLNKRASQHYVPAFSVAMLHMGLEDTNRGFEWLEKALEERSSWLTSLKVDPLFDSIRPDSRFAPLLKRVGLD